MNAFHSCNVRMILVKYSMFHAEVTCFKELWKWNRKDCSFSWLQGRTNSSRRFRLSDATSGGKHLIWEFSIFVMIFQGISRRIQEFDLEQTMLHPFMENPPCNRESLNSKSSMIINCMTVCFHDFVLVLFFFWMILDDFN